MLLCFLVPVLLKKSNPRDLYQYYVFILKLLLTHSPKYRHQYQPKRSQYGRTIRKLFDERVSLNQYKVYSSVNIPSSIRCVCLIGSQTLYNYQLLFAFASFWIKVIGVQCVTQPCQALPYAYSNALEFI